MRDQTDTGSDGAIPILQRIADTLGVPVSAFSDPAAGPPRRETDELLAAWAAIPSAQARRRILNLAQRAASRAEAG